MSKIDDLAKLIVDIIEKKDSKKPRALDTVGTVTRVDGDYAWIRLAGSEEETPVKETITVKKGDKVQVRASKGSAWIVGNETAPPTDDTLAKKALENSDKAGKAAKRASDMTIVNDTLYYLASDQDEGVTVEDEGWTKEPQEVTESLPYLWAYHDYERGNGTHFKSDPVIIAMYAEDGKGIDTLTTYYALGTSTTTAPTTGWATSFTYLSGYYIWRKELITYDDGTTKWTTAVYDAGLTQSLELAYDTAQYIWTQTNTSDTNIPTGQYVTEYPKAQYTNQSHTNYCKGGSLLLRSAALYLRQGANKLVELVQAGLKIYEPNDATNPVAQFLSSGAVIGKENGGHAQLGSNGMYIYTGATPLASFGSAVILGNQNANHTQIATGTIAAKNGSTTLWSLAPYLSQSASGLAINASVCDVSGSLVAGNIDCGERTFSNAVTAGSYGDYSVSFNKTFPSTPKVVASLKMGVNNQNMGNTTLSVQSISTTGFTARFYNASTYDRTPVFDWIAMS